MYFYIVVDVVVRRHGTILEASLVTGTLLGHKFAGESTKTDHLYDTFDGDGGGGSGSRQQQQQCLAHHATNTNRALHQVDQLGHRLES